MGRRGRVETREEVGTIRLEINLYTVTTSTIPPSSRKSVKTFAKVTIGAAERESSARRVEVEYQRVANSGVTRPMGSLSAQEPRAQKSAPRLARNRAFRVSTSCGIANKLTFWQRWWLPSRYTGMY